MKPGRKPQALTERELQLMKILWECPEGMFVRQIVELHPEPRPHVNTVATILKILEEKGHVGHDVIGNSHRYHALTEKDDFRDRSLRSLIGDFFGNSYKSVVSALVKEEKISVDELQEIIDMVQAGKKP